MKLKFSNTYNNENKTALWILIVILIFLIIMHIPVLKMKASINIVLIFMELIVVVAIICLIYSIKKKKDIRIREVWKNGEKYQGYIEEAGYIKSNYRHYRDIHHWKEYVDEKVPYQRNQNISNYRIIDYYITVKYNNSYYIDIKSIKYNDAYVLLGMLLNPFPIKEKIQVPIDMYLYKNKVYADIDSIKLHEVEGYEECKKIIEKTRQNDWY
ncbi:MAG: hypothetical protein IJN50_06280 [Clostridia bacterium]|nr:hypothetical protein [Clostridia bacterium]